MNTLRALPLAERLLLLVAVVLAVGLMAVYVQLLHDSLRRGDELRKEQRIAATRKPTKVARAEVQDTSLRARQPARVADARAR